MNEQRPPIFPRHDRRASAWCRRIALASLLGVACAPSLNAPGYPLYTDAAPRPAPADVVRLYGLIASVDGRDVSQIGSAFELSPGRHLVTTRSDPVESINYRTMVGQPSARTFLITMKPGYAYIVKQLVLEEMDSRFRFAVFAEAHDPTGGLDQVLYPAAPEDAAPAVPRGPRPAPSADANRLEHPGPSPRSW